MLFCVSTASCSYNAESSIKGGEQWYEGVVSSYSVITGKYSIYFPSDGQTEEASFDDEDLDNISIQVRECS